MLDLKQKQTEYLSKRLEKEQALLDAIKTNLPEIEQQLKLFALEYEDGIYRFYHQSFKVYSLQDRTTEAIVILRRIADATGNQLCEWFEQITTNGTGAKFEAEHNRDWSGHTRPIVEAFFHAKYFLEAMAKYGRELESPPDFLPFGWAAILELYNQR
jgi:hypothetical protein